MKAMKLFLGIVLLGALFQLLIRQHAQAVVKFVEKGMPAAMAPHELPAGYAAEKNK